METIGIALLGIWLCALAAWAAFRPRGMMDWLESFWGEGGRLGWIVAIRTVIGLYLLWVAESTPMPAVVAGIGVFFLLAAVAVIAMGRARIDRYVDWWVARSENAIRGIAAAWVAFAGLLFWAGFAAA